MTDMKLAVIAGDGIGPEVVAEGLKVLDAALAPAAGFDRPPSTTSAPRATTAPARCCPTPCWTSSAATTRSCSARSATRACRRGVLERGLLLRLRFAAGPPRQPAPGAALPRRGDPAGRQGPAGHRHGRRPRGHRGPVRRRRRHRCARAPPHEVATEESLNTAFGVERVVRDAFARATARRAARLTLVHKTNVLTHAGDLWHAHLRRGRRPSSPTSATDYLHVDAASMFFVTQPERFDVVVTDNLFGDILTDIGAAIAGGIGLAAQRQHQPEPGQPEHVRAGARLGAGHRRAGQGRPDGDRAVGRDAAGPPRARPGRAAGSRRPSPTTSPRAVDRVRSHRADRRRAGCRSRRLSPDVANAPGRATDRHATCLAADREIGDTAVMAPIPSPGTAAPRAGCAARPVPITTGRSARDRLDEPRPARRTRSGRDPGQPRVRSATSPTTWCTIDWTEGRGWHDAQLVPYGPLAARPGDACHCTTARRSSRGSRRTASRTDRSRRSARRRTPGRFQRSARRLAMPELPEDLFLEAIEALVEQDRAWVPGDAETSLYLRPFMFATEVGPRRAPANEYLFMLIASPAGAYFPGGVKPVSVWLSTEYVRAAPGGTGEAKCARQLRRLAGRPGAGRRAGLRPGGLARRRRAPLGRGDGRHEPVLRLRLRRLRATRHPRAHRHPAARRHPRLAAQAGRRPRHRGRGGADHASTTGARATPTAPITEVFACGTAAVITPVGSVRSATGEWTVGDGQPGPVTMRLRRPCWTSRPGRADPHGWMHRLV